MSALICFLIGVAIWLLIVIICSIIRYCRYGIKDFTFDEPEWPVTCVFLLGLLAAVAVAVCLG